MLQGSSIGVYEVLPRELSCRILRIIYLVLLFILFYKKMTVDSTILCIGQGTRLHC